MMNNVKKRLNTLRPAMTMVELLVAVAVLAILIMIFGRILSQSQRVVTGSQELMKFNASGTAAANTLRKDIQKVSTTGFLYIVDEYVTVGSETWPRAKMYMGLNGSFDSWTSPSISGTGAIIGIGLCNQSGITDTSKPKLIWRNRCIMTTNTSAPLSPSATNDTWQHDFSSIENSGALTKRNYLLTQWLNVISANADWSPSASTTGMSLPPVTIDDVNMLWKYLVPNVNKLSIMWTKGDVTANNKSLIWYGRDIDGVLHVPGDFPNYPSNYTNNNSNRRFNDKMSYTGQNVESIYGGTPATNYPKFEFQDSSNRYCAIWNSELTNDYWPTAIKITYEVTDGKVDNPTTKTYEIICNTAISN